MFKKVLSLILVVTLLMICSMSAFAETGETVVTGDIQATVISFTVPSSTSFTINPNGATPAERFISADFNITNTSVAPLKVEISSFAYDPTSTHIFTEKLPTAYSDADWGKLGKAKSESEIALGVFAKTPAQWRLLTKSDTLYSAQVASPTTIGEIDPSASATFTFGAKHGNAFSSAKTTKYKIVFLFSLA